jgi:hypothetical protein
MNIEDPKIIVALISAGVSVATVLLSFLLKSWFERNFIIFKLEAEHRYDQKKKIKEVIAKNKTQLLEAAETLNHRLWNFLENYKKDWHRISDLKNLPDNYYFASFTYRILAFFAWVRKVETDMVFLDTTIATRKDLDFIKFLRLFTQIMCDVVLFKGLDYDHYYATDHFFQNDFIHMCKCCWKDDGVISYSEFKNNTNECLEECKHMAEFLNGLNPNENRLRWDRLQSLHLVLLMFLSAYGYDFQRTGRRKMKILISKFPRPIKTIDNLRLMLERIHLKKQKEVKQVLAIL